MNTIDLEAWRRDAENEITYINRGQGGISLEAQERIIQLIDLVKKKDELLNRIEKNMCGHVSEGWSQLSYDYVMEAYRLTAELK